MAETGKTTKNKKSKGRTTTKSGGKIEDLSTRLIKIKQKAISIILSPYRFFKFICFVTGFIVVTTTIICLILAFNFYTSLPNIEKLKFRTLKKMAINRTVKKFESRSKIKYYKWTTMPNIDRGLLFSIVTSEDATFFEHNGVNFNAMIDSFAENIRKKEYASGGSTITQQVVKNVFLKNEKSLARKTKEILIARKLERRFTKNQILEIYLNIAEFGPDIFGIKSATKTFFKKSPSRSNAAEGAFISLMLPSPRRYFHSIFKNQYLSKPKRRKMRRILRDMLYNEYIGPKQYKKYIRFGFLKKFKF